MTFLDFLHATFSMSLRIEILGESYLVEIFVGEKMPSFEIAQDLLDNFLSYSRIPPYNTSLLQPVFFVPQTN